jgi:excisionase family DNA binding protein
LVDVGGVAAYLGTSVRHVRRLVAERRIPHTKVGGLVRFKLDDIDAWLAASQRGPVVPNSAQHVPLAPVRSISRRRSAQTEPHHLPGQLRLDE